MEPEVPRSSRGGGTNKINMLYADQIGSSNFDLEDCVFAPTGIAIAILEGRQPQHLKAKTLRTLPELPLDRVKQSQIPGFARPRVRFERPKTSLVIAP